MAITTTKIFAPNGIFLRAGYICVCTMLRVLICQGDYYFMCLYICVCTMLRVLIYQGVYYFMCLLGERSEPHTGEFNRDFA